jgi:superfamily I DNA and/or RNA helicase
LLIGSEKNYVILSLVRSLPEKEIEKDPPKSWLRENLGFLTDKHQMNVALTRAKRGLFIIGKRPIKVYFTVVELFLLMYVG